MYLESLSPVQKVDFAFYLIFGFSGLMLVGLTLTAAYFIWRYHHTRHPKSEDIKGNVLVEVIWTLIPSLMVLALFHYGWVGYKALRDVPDGAMDIRVTARMWSWNFTYPNGKHSNILVVPVNAPVKLSMTSPDVIHSFFAPAFRIKIDTVPGMTTYAWFKAERTGEYDVFCAEYCGDKHAEMLSTIRVLDEAAYTAWLAQVDEAEGAEVGKKFMEAQGCFACHSLDGAPGVGPSFKGAWNHLITVHVSGKKQRIKADDAYMRESITDPGKMIVDGYDNTMPPYTDFSKEQLDGMMEFLKSLSPESGDSAGSHTPPPASPAQSAAPAENAPPAGGVIPAPMAGNGTVKP